MKEIISILTNIGDLQATMQGSNITDSEVMERLSSMRRTALSILKEDGPCCHASASYRKDVLDKADALGVMIGLSDMRNVPDSELFRIAAAADTMAASAKQYLKMRNLLAAEKSWKNNRKLEVA